MIRPLKFVVIDNIYFLKIVMENIKVYSLRKLVHGNSFSIIEFLYVPGTVSVCSLGAGGSGSLKFLKFFLIFCYLLISNLQCKFNMAI